MTKVLAQFVCFVLIFVVVAENQVYGEDQDMSQHPRALHPEQREAVSPSSGVKVAQNPPALLWPIRKGKRVRYSVRLSQDRKFSRQKTLSANGVRWAKFAGNAETVGIGGCFHTEEPLETVSEKDYKAGELDHPDMS